MRDLSISFCSDVVVTGVGISINISLGVRYVSYKIPKLDPTVRHLHPVVMEYL